MISKWLESSVDIMKWCSECSSNLSANTIKTLAHKISIGLNLNCIGIIRQIIIFAESFHNPKLSVQMNRKTLTLVLSILVWIVLMCTPIELLHFTYNLYNLSNNKVLSFSEFEELLTDLFLIDQIPENYQPNSQAYQGNKEVFYWCIVILLLFIAFELSRHLYNLEFVCLFTYIRFKLMKFVKTLWSIFNSSIIITIIIIIAAILRIMKWKNFCHAI